MISIEAIKKEIQKTLSEGSSESLDKSKAKKNSNKMLFLKKALYYLETNPSEESVSRQIDQVKKDIEEINDPANFKKFFRPKKYNGDLLQLYHKVKNLSGKQEQLKLLLFIQDAKS